ncbi:hypothetical protein CBR_g24132 [Chara braunii]|uniref:Reverse transcriptase domain-containing protein n=1 Tax=Chara braunii TaxID=69332 RepID=A0A388L5V4_CHABU|nr:hypothetical protein CBR_g24132 [Chara braunii]|eukprot:GBG77686.1 hypothetical protein CBR_g24132 [Chara braunii]
MTLLTRSQTAGMDQKAGETDEAYEARLAAIMTESKQRAEASAAAWKKREAEAERLCQVAEDQREKHAAAAAKAADEERVRQREILFREETALHAQARDWQKEAENGDPVDYGTRIALLLNRVTDLLATCIAQQEDIHSLDHANQALTKHIQQLERRPVATFSAGPSDLVDRVNVLEIDVRTLKTETQWLDQQNSMPSGDWISEFQRLASTPKLPMNFDGIKLYFIKRSRPALQNALTQGAENLNTGEELFNKAAQIIVANLEAKNIGRLPARAHRELSHKSQGLRSVGKVSTAESDAATLSTPSEPVAVRVTSLGSGANAEVVSPPILHSFEDCAARLVPSLNSRTEGHDVCAVSSPFGSSDIESSSSGPSRDLARAFNIEDWDRLTPEDFAWLPLPSTDCLPESQCATLSAHLHTCLALYAPPTSSTEDEVAVGDILAYVSKVAREFRTQRYDDNNAPLLYVHIQVGQASCSTLLDSSATCNFISQSFMQRADLGPRVRRKAHPTAIKLADGRTQQLLDRYIEAVPVYFAPHACELVTFDVLDTDFDIILGMPWLASVDHMVNFHWRTLTVRDAFGAEVPCTIPLPHPSIRCPVVMAKSFRATCAYERTNEIGLCFLRTVAATESQPTDLSSDPRVVRLLDEFADIFESPTGVVPDRPISHEVILEAGAAPPKGCIYRMSEEELTISIRPQDRYKTAFKTRYGHFEWVVMPFGFTNAPATFQAAMTNEFRAMLDRLVLVYLDDILVYSRTLEEHLEHLRRVLETLRRAKYKANRDKCEFVRQELEYLGHVVTQGISPLSDKIQAIQDWRKPQNVTDVRSFLGLAGYYQRFIKGYSKIAAHLSKLQCEDRPFDFGMDARESFLTLKAALLSAEVLRIYDPLLPTHVTTDASGYGIGAVLEQHDGVDWHPIEYFNKKVSVVHSIDDARKKELLAFVHALKRWRHFLLG